MRDVLAIRQSMGSCWFSRNANLLTRSDPEGSSHGRCRVCRDVAGKAPPNFQPFIISNLSSLLFSKTFIYPYVFTLYMCFLVLFSLGVRVNNIELKIVLNRK